jgi:hypothetical protein
MRKNVGQKRCADKRLYQTYTLRESCETYYEDEGSENDFLSKPQSHTLYAINSASPDDSIILVRRRTKPMNVKNTKDVNATPSSVDVSGDDAAEG